MVVGDKSKKIILALVLIILALTLASFFDKEIGLQPVGVYTLQNSEISAVFEESSEGVYLKELSTSNFGEIDFKEGFFWELVFIDDPNNIANAVSLNSNDFSEVVFDSQQESLEVTYSGQNIIAGEVIVRLIINLVGDSVRFKIDVDNQDNTYALYKVNYPLIKYDRTEIIGDSFMAVPYFSGIIQNVNDFSETTFTMRHPGIAGMQFLSLFNEVESNQLYLQTNDDSGYVKDFSISRNANLNSIDIGFAHFPENNIVPGNDFVLSYEVEASLIGGDWYDAARRYREWALLQPWSSGGKIEDLGPQDFSNKLKNAKLLLLQSPAHNSQVDYDDYVVEGRRIRDYFEINSNEEIMLWYDWHDNNFFVTPEHLPPRPGVLSALQDARLEGFNVIPYIIPHIWTVDVNSGIPSNLQNLASIEEDGSLHLYFNTVNDNIELDPSLSAARELQKSLVVDIVNLGFNGIYWDYWSGLSARLDYSDSHGHSRGGGDYWEQGKIVLGQETKDALKNIDSEIFFTSESLDEFLINDLEMVYTQVFTHFGNGLILYPIWETVYHDLILTSDLSAGVLNIPSLTDETSLLFSFIYHSGRMPSLANWQEQSFAYLSSTDPGYLAVQQSVFDFFKKLVNLDEAWKYQRFGERLRPLDNSLENFLIGIDPSNSVLQKYSGSVWKAGDGEIGIIFTNVGDQQENLDLNMEFIDYELSGDYSLYRNNLDGTRTEVLSNIDNDFVYNFDLSGSDVLLLELVQCFDLDSDGYSENPNELCLNQEVDCDDGNSGINPGVAEICDNVDNNCNGEIDEGGVCNVPVPPSGPGGNGGGGSGGGTTYNCNDGLDNDNDGFIDFPNDIGCQNAEDNNETNIFNPNEPECRDGIDNDGDGDIDYPSDVGCENGLDDSENTESLEAIGGEGGNLSGGELEIESDIGKPILVIVIIILIIGVVIFVIIRKMMKRSELKQVGGVNRFFLF